MQVWLFIIKIIRTHATLLFNRILALQYAQQYPGSEILLKNCSLSVSSLILFPSKEGYLKQESYTQKKDRKALRSNYKNFQLLSRSQYR